MIAGSISVYGDMVDQALVGIKRLRPYVDRYVVIVDESVTEEQKKKLTDAGCEVYFHPFEDDFGKFYNQGIEKCQIDDWIISHDPDEWFNEQFCHDIRQICNDAENSGADSLSINCHYVYYEQQGNRRETVEAHWKELVFRNRSGTRFNGKKLHVCLQIPTNKRRRVRIAQDKYWWDHVKYWHEVWERAGRNLWICGGGNDIGVQNPSWMPLREICNSLGLDTWSKTRAYLRRGNIDQRFKNWFLENNYRGRDYEEEEMEFGRWYFEFLHSEEATFPDGRVWKPILEMTQGSSSEVMAYVEKCYLEVLGRNADQDGKEHYTQEIVAEHLKREDLPNIFRQSKEYKEIFG